MFTSCLCGFPLDCKNKLVGLLAFFQKYAPSINMVGTLDCELLWSTGADVNGSGHPEYLIQTFPMPPALGACLSLTKMQNRMPKIMSQYTELPFHSICELQRTCQ